MTEWLKTNGVNIVKTTLFGEYITAQAKVSTWERMFDTKMHEFHPIRNKKSAEGIESSEIDKSSSVIRAESFSLPEEINDHVHSVFRYINLPPTLRHHSKIKRTFTDEETKAFLASRDPKNLRLQSTSPLTYVTPTDLPTIYNIKEPAVNSLATQSAYGGLGQTYRQT